MTVLNQFTGSVTTGQHGNATGAWSAPRVSPPSSPSLLAPGFPGG